MGKMRWKSYGIGGVSLLLLFFAFQNCAPAKLNTGQVATLSGEQGSSDEPSTLPDAGEDPGSVSPSPTPVMTPTPMPARIFKVRTRVNNSSVMDAPYATAGSNVHLWANVTTPNQVFEFTAANEIKAHGFCLMPESNTRGARVILAVCAGTPIQKWTVDTVSGAITSSNGYCLDLANSMIDNGTSISAWTCHGEINQRWDLVP